MQPEEGQRAAQQRNHEFRRDPCVRVAGEVVRRRVRLEGHKSRGRGCVALLAGVEAVGRIDRGSGIVDALDVVTAVAVEALRRIGIAQLVDLAATICITCTIYPESSLGVKSHPPFKCGQGICVKCDMTMLCPEL